MTVGRVLGFAVLFSLATELVSAIEYPASLEEAKTSRAELQVEVDRMRENPRSTPELVRAGERLLGLLAEIEELHARDVTMSELAAARPERHRLARAALDAEPLRAMPAAGVIDVVEARRAVAEATGRLDAVRAVQQSLHDEASIWLGDERIAAITRRNVSRERLDEVRAHVDRRRALASSAEEQQAIQLHLDAAQLAMEHSTRWAALLDRRVLFLSAELPVVELEIEAALEQRRLAEARLAVAVDMQLATLEHERDAAAERARLARREAASASLSADERIHGPERAETSRLEAKVAGCHLELKELLARESIVDILSRARDRFARVRVKDERTRALGASTGPLIRGEISRLDALRSQHLVGDEEATLRRRRNEVVRELLAVEQRSFDLDERWAERTTALATTDVSAADWA